MKKEIIKKFEYLPIDDIFCLLSWCDAKEQDIQNKALEKRVEDCYNNEFEELFYSEEDDL